MKPARLDLGRRGPDAAELRPNAENRSKRDWQGDTIGDADYRFLHAVEGGGHPIR